MVFRLERGSKLEAGAVTLYVLFLTLRAGWPQAALSLAGTPSLERWILLSSPDRLPESRWQRSRVCDVSLEHQPL